MGTLKRTLSREVMVNREMLLAVLDGAIGSPEADANPDRLVDRCGRRSWFAGACTCWRADARKMLDSLKEAMA